MLCVCGGATVVHAALWHPLHWHWQGDNRGAGSKLVASYKFVYNCPMYRTARRRADADFIMDLPLSTSVPPEHWCLRGAAVLCQLHE